MSNIDDEKDKENFQHLTRDLVFDDLHDGPHGKGVAAGVSHPVPEHLRPHTDKSTF